ncbi:MAG TPA: FAD-binding protein, partial [Acidimicrobiia bacterium]|nr:FAD-binding protein [Acidimicrobiia bacterium]
MALRGGRTVGPDRNLWRNWGRNQRCHPAAVETPTSELEVAEAVRRAAAAGQKVKAVGSGHSFTGAACTDGRQLRLDRLDRVVAIDEDTRTVTVEAGIPLWRLNDELAQRGLALANLGDIDRQTISGAISTATHGTGAQLPNISAQVAGIELVTGSGDVVSLGPDDPDGGVALRAARVGIGALGAIAAVTLRTVPAFALHRVDEPLALDRVLGEFDRFAADNDHFEFFVFPYTDQALTIRRNRTAGPLRPRSSVNVMINETFLQNTVGEWLFRVTRRFPALIPRITRASAWFLSEGDYIDHSFKIF